MIYQIGNHRVKHGSIMEDMTELMNGQKADLFYCDPPWGPGLLKTFETLNHKAGEQAPAVEFGSFTARLFEVADRYAKSTGMIEYGIKWADQIIRAGQIAGLQYRYTLDATYKSGSRVLPHHVHVFTKGMTEIPSKESYGDLKPFAESSSLVQKILSKFPTGLVFDPCCGLGATADAAKKMGWTFYGNELTKKRLNQTMKRLI
jgi:hypothetical protein